MPSRVLKLTCKPRHTGIRSKLSTNECSSVERLCGTVYDLSNRPSIRFIEGLLYKSKCYNEASQSIVIEMSRATSARLYSALPGCTIPPAYPRCALQIQRAEGQRVWCAALISTSWCWIEQSH